MNTPFLDFLLWFQVAKRSGRFYLQTSHDAAELFLLDGFVIHTQAGLDIGLEPFLQVLHDWEEPKIIAWEVNRMPEFQTLWLDASSTNILLTRYAKENRNATGNTPYRDRPLSEESQEDGSYTFTFNVETENGDSFSKDLDSDLIQVGRDDKSELVINDSSLSRQHAFITRKGRMLFIHDLNSSNGTLVNDSPIIFAQVEEGHVIKFGNATCTFTARERSQGLDLNYENVMKTSLIPKGLLNQARQRQQPSQNLHPTAAIAIVPDVAQPAAKPRKTRPLGMSAQLYP
jgi:pSer/pThr/pTyr-binding forkhead associated (FHA) protein